VAGRDRGFPEIGIGSLQVHRRARRHQARVSFSAASLRAERRERLAAAMAAEKIDILVVAGNPWRSDYLRYTADLAPLCGQVFALVEREAQVQVVPQTPLQPKRSH